MKALELKCSCPSKSCTHTLQVKMDSESPTHIMLSSSSDTVAFGDWVSLTKEDSLKLARFILNKYKEKDVTPAVPSSKEC
jgi:hypothetical protein